MLKSNNEVYFRLRCRKFIEMIRKDAEENLRRDKGIQQPDTNNNPAPPAPKPSRQFDDDQDMEVDDGGEWEGGEPMDDVDSQPPPAVGQLLQEALESGQELRAEFANGSGSDPEMSRQLDEIFALIAYENPLKEEGVKHLLDRSGRVAVAEELNSAILRECGPFTLSPIAPPFISTPQLACGRVLTLKKITVSLGKQSRSALETMYAQTVVLLEQLREDGGDGAFVAIQDVMDRITKPVIRS